MRLGIDETRFTLDGVPTFLLGISYYAGIGAPDDILLRDLDAMRRFGFNWLRVWATWTGFGHDVSAVEDDGAPREPHLSRLKRIAALADERGMALDVTLTRGQKYSAQESRLWGKIPDFPSHRRAVETLATALLPYRNLYIDLGNERNIRDSRHVPYSELREMRALVREIDSERIVGASDAGRDIPTDDLREYLFSVEADYIAPHRERRPGSPAETASATVRMLDAMRTLGKSVPLHYQEPFRRGFNPGYWDPTAEDFITDLRNAHEHGAAGWCFHNGDNRDGSDEKRPRRSFDLRDGALFDQWDDEETAFLDAIRTLRFG